MAQPELELEQKQEPEQEHALEPIWGLHSHRRLRAPGTTCTVMSGEVSELRDVKCLTWDTEPPCPVPQPETSLHFKTTCHTAILAKVAQPKPPMSVTSYRQGRPRVSYL